MKPQHLDTLVKRAIKNVILRDSALFERDASEWAIAHRLAVYLEQEIPGWDVDCEYNRQGVNQDPKAFARGQRVRPDVVLHKRGDGALRNNLLIIEVKKEPDTYDAEKVRTFTAAPEGKRLFQYQYGLALTFLPLRLRWYRGGAPL
jgi:hypothetical protein